MARKTKRTSTSSKKNSTFDPTLFKQMVAEPVKKSAPYKYMPNIGGCMDIPFGSYVKTSSGLYTLNGGLGATTGFIAKGNSFKSSLINSWITTAGLRVKKRLGVCQIILYDTEATVSRPTIMNMVNTIWEGLGVTEEDRPDLFESQDLVLTDSSCYSGNKFMDMLETKLKQKEDRSLYVKTPLIDPENKEPFKILFPTFVTIDSLTDFKTDRVLKKEDTTEIGDSEANTLHMLGGLDKVRLLGYLSPMCIQYSMYVGMTAQLGKKSGISTSGFGQYNTKDIPAMKADEKVTGVSGKFMYSTTNSLKADVAKPLDITISGNKRAPRYPINSNSTNTDTKDLFVVDQVVLRSKTGKSSVNESMCVSQTRGWDATLTEFYRIDVILRKGQERYGIVGSDRNYALTLYPDCKLSRTTVITKYRKDMRLRRAINITSELSQIYDYHRDGEFRDYYLTPEQLYVKLEELGYDWDKILDTRGWYGLEEEIGTKNEPISTMTLLAIAKEEIVLDWLKK